MKFHFFIGYSYDSNIIVCESGGEAVIVDTGMGQHPPDIPDGLNVRAIVLTHIHYDHSGGAAALARKYGAKVYINSEELEFLRKGDNVMSAARMFMARLQPVKDALPLEEGDKVKVGSEDLEVLHLPGHSPGSIGLYSAEDRVLISGDTVFADHGVGRWDLPGGNKSALKKSIKKIMKLDFDIFYPGHGPKGRKNEDLPPWL